MGKLFNMIKQPYFIFVIIIYIKLCFVRAVVFERFHFIESLFIVLPMIIFLLGIIELIFKKRKFVIYFVINLAFSFLFFSIIVYYQYFGTLPTYTALLDIHQAGEVTGSIAMLIKPVYWLLFIDLVFLAGMLLIPRNRIFMQSSGSLFRNKYGVSTIVLSLVIIVYHILQSIGGGIVNEMKKAESMGLLSYEVYVVYADIKRDYTPDHPITLRSIQSVKGIIEFANPQYHGIAQGQDIYIVQLEAFQNFFVNLEVGGREVTPNLNRLVEESFYFPNVYQQIGKGNTSDAEFITNTSIYTSGSIAMSKQSVGREIPGFPRYLKPLGYESVTLHTNEVRFWDREAMYKALGFDKYYDKEYFGEEDSILFGASDEVLYDKSIDIFLDMKQRDKKIYANLIAMSSHGPFEIPEKKNLFPLTNELEGTVIGKYTQAAHYADYALGQFINDLKDTGLWENAVLLVNGDHFGFSTSNGKVEKELAAELIDVEKYTKVHMFNIPMVIRVPGHEEAVVIETIGGQVDFLPTLANFIGLSLKDQIYFGQDLVNYTNNLIPQRVYLPTGSFVNNEVFFIPGKGFNDGWMLPIKEDAEVNNLEQYRNDFNRALKLSEIAEKYLHTLPKVN